MSHPVALSITHPSTTAIRTEANTPTAAVGLITEPEQAEHIIASAEADAVFLARAMLRNPRWALMASEKLGHRIDWPMSLDRGRTVSFAEIDKPVRR